MLFKSHQNGSGDLAGLLVLFGASERSSKSVIGDLRTLPETLNNVPC